MSYRGVHASPILLIELGHEAPGWLDSVVAGDSVGYEVLHNLPFASAPSTVTLFLLMVAVLLVSSPYASTLQSKSPLGRTPKKFEASNGVNTASGCEHVSLSRSDNGSNEAVFIAFNGYIYVAV